MFGGQSYRGSEDAMYLISRVVLQDYLIKRSCDIMEWIY